MKAHYLSHMKARTIKTLPPSMNVPVGQVMECKHQFLGIDNRDTGRQTAPR